MKGETENLSAGFTKLNTQLVYGSMDGKAMLINRRLLCFYIYIERERWRRVLYTPIAVT